MSTFLNMPFRPTEAQQTLLYALKKKGERILFRAETGTGKSFVLAMYAINLDRSKDQSNRPSTTALILVPNPDLAMQYHYWITKVLTPSLKDPSRTERIVQTLFRTNKEAEEQQEKTLRENPNPHIIISTPTRMLDLISQTANAFDIQNLKCIVLDEADDLIQTPDTSSPKKIHHHTPGEILLDWIHDSRTALEIDKSLQIIATSATLNVTFKSYIAEKPWFPIPINVHGILSEKLVYTTPQKADQHVLLVSLRRSPRPELSPDRILIQPARLPPVTLHHNIRINPSRDDESPPQTEYPPNYLAVAAMQRILRETSTQKAIALVPHGASKADFVWACKYFGITNAQELRFNVPSSGCPGGLEPPVLAGGGAIVYVASPKEIRGLDMRNVGIVFITGEFGSIEDYVHIVGRTGRRGPRGQVITLLEDSTENLGMRLTNIAVKLVRTGSRVVEGSFPSIEMDLKALPEDPYEEVRKKAGIVTFTEEVREKEKRERLSMEERNKWLLMEGVDVDMGSTAEKAQEALERPQAFAMEPVKVQKRIDETEPVNIDSNRWRDVLSQSLRSTKERHPRQSIESVIVGSPPKATTMPPEEYVTKEEEESLARGVKKPITEKELPPFPLKPSFPRKQYNAAWKDVQQYYDKLRQENPESSDISVTA